MTPRALITHILFAALALGFAWQQGHAVAEKSGGPTSTTLLEVKPGDVVELRYAWPKGTTHVASKGKEMARSVLVELDREIDKKADKKKPDDKKDDKKKPDDNKNDKKDEVAAADAGPEAPLEPVAPEREQARFPGGKTVTSSLEALEPLKTRRTLGDVDAERLKAMGLDKPERTLVITTAGGKKLELEIGESAYGGQGRYARVKGESTVHLLEPAVVTGLEGTSDSLMEKRVVVANVEDIVGFAARAGDKEKSFVQADRDQSAKRKFVPKDDPASAKEEPGKAMTTLRNLRAQKLADDKLAGSAIAAFALELEGRPPQKVEILERVDGTGHLVRTDGWTFEISETQAKELLEDLDAALE